MLLKTNVPKHKGGEKQWQVNPQNLITTNTTVTWHPSGPLEDDDEGIVWVWNLLRWVIRRSSLLKCITAYRAWDSLGDAKGKAVWDCGRFTKSGSFSEKARRRKDQSGLDPLAWITEKEEDDREMGIHAQTHCMVLGTQSCYSLTSASGFSNS